MRRSSLLLVTTLVALAVAPFPQMSASASCAAPYLEDAEGLAVRPGATVTVEGRAFVDGCQDSMGCETGLGCDSCEYDEPPPTPMQDVQLRLVQGDRSWELAEADAGTAEGNELGRVTWTFDVPAGVRPGPARLVSDHIQPVRIRIR